MSATIEAPRSPRTPVRKRRVNWEKWGWLYMRFSGVLLAGFVPRQLMHIFGGE